MMGEIPTDRNIARTERKENLCKERSKSNVPFRACMHPPKALSAFYTINIMLCVEGDRLSTTDNHCCREPKTASLPLNILP